jgi:hypothetical protein
MRSGPGNVTGDSGQNQCPVTLTRQVELLSSRPSYDKCQLPKPFSSVRRLTILGCADFRGGFADGQCILNQGILTDGEHIKEIGPWEEVRPHAPKDVTVIDCILL